jgi:hypothetical protein
MLNIVESVKIGHCEKSSSYEHSVILNGYDDRVVWIYTYKTLWMVIMKEKLLIIDLTLILI